MLNILFVDDEPNILAGLQRMLRPQRHEWNMAFVSSGLAALDLLAQRKMDVLVTDMKMPGMDGAQLLQQASERYPYLVRLILSGHAEKEMMMRTVNLAHQYLAKPCDAEMLKMVVRHTCALRDLAGNETVRQLVAQLKVVPSLPAVYQQLMAELQLPDPSQKKLGNIIEQDPGITAKLLQIVNSARFSIRKPVVSAKTAVALLGIDMISALALSVGLFAQLQGAGQPPLIEQLWEQSLKVASLAQQLALAQAPADAAAAFTGGLLHNLGGLLLAVNLPHEYAAAQALQEREQLTPATAETHLFGASGAAIGAYLLGLWGLPTSIVEAVGYQDTPQHQAAYSFTPLTAVHLARGLIKAADHPVLTASDEYFDQEYLQRLHLWEKLPAWYALCHQPDLCES